MKKVATLTYHRHDNYGAVLQCYALQEVLKSMGVEVNVLDYICKASLQPYTLMAIKSRGLFPCVIGTLGTAVRLPRKKAFQEFRKKLTLSKPYTRNTIIGAESEYDCFIVGSDNVWNPEITGFDKTYFLDFIKDSNKKNSYAASTGTNTISEKYKDDVAQLLSEFRFITTREEGAAKNLSELLHRRVVTVLDPTLLLSSERWGNLAICKRHKKPYILAYQMLPSKKFVQFVNIQAKRLGCETIFVPFPQGARGYRMHSNMSCGPEEWLGLFKDAEYIVTDSFHGCAFSILFHKRFAVMISQLGERITNLLTLTGLNSRVVADIDLFHIEDNIMYDIVDRRLSFARNESLKVLKRIALGE